MKPNESGSDSKQPLESWRSFRKPEAAMLLSATERSNVTRTEIKPVGFVGYWN